MSGSSRNFYEDTKKLDAWVGLKKDQDPTALFLIVRNCRVQCKPDMKLDPDPKRINNTFFQQGSADLG